MLRNDLYHILSKETCEGGWQYRVALHPESAIYAAHFKGMPVTPGACLVQMACELASDATAVPLDVAEASEIRFLKPILPEECTELNVELAQDETDAARWAIRMLDGETQCAWMKLTLA